jgi:hypothetical protein
MAHLQDQAFERFVTERKKDLQRIAHHTRGEHQLPDVINEAWVIAFDLGARHESAVEFLNPVLHWSAMAVAIH